MAYCRSTIVNPHSPFYDHGSEPGEKNLADGVEGRGSGVSRGKSVAAKCTFKDHSVARAVIVVAHGCIPPEIACHRKQAACRLTPVYKRAELAAATSPLAIDSRQISRNYSPGFSRCHLRQNKNESMHESVSPARELTSGPRNAPIRACNEKSP